MNLILQSLFVDTTSLRHIASVVKPQQIIENSPQCIHCIGITFTDDRAIKQSKIKQMADQERVDCYWDNSHKKLTDFKLLVMDMDSTLITIECIDEIADMQGLKPKVASITEAAMRGDIDFAESLTRRVALLKDMPASALNRVYDERLKLSFGAEKLISTVQHAGIKTLLVSGGFTFFTDRLKDKLKLDYSHANKLEIIDDKLTGRVLGDIVDAAEKRRTVERTCSELGITPSQAIVIGDGANDLAMMEIAGLSVAYHAKPAVRAKAHAALNYVGLDGVLNLF
jgi:phosphoserine phosphatase